MLHVDPLAPVSARAKRTGVILSAAAPASQLAVLLRYFRCRIDPQIAALGPHPRLTSRRGKPVTQEELSEYLGVSRTWYGLLESKKPVRVSLVLLDRLSKALMLDREERAKLFALALPELDFPHAPPSF